MNHPSVSSDLAFCVRESSTIDNIPSPNHLVSTAVKLQSSAHTFPPELAGEILHHLQDDLVSLKSLCLTNTVWSTESTRFLYRRVTVCRRSPMAVRLFDILAGNNLLGGYIRELKLRDVGALSFGTGFAVQRALAGDVTWRQVTSAADILEAAQDAERNLEMMCGTTKLFPYIDPAFVATIVKAIYLPGLIWSLATNLLRLSLHGALFYAAFVENAFPPPALSRVQTLSLSACEFDSYAGMTRFLLAFPSITEIRLVNISVVEPFEFDCVDTHIEAAQGTPKVPLHNILIDNAPPRELCRSIRNFSLAPIAAWVLAHTDSKTLVHLKLQGFMNRDILPASRLLRFASSVRHLRLSAGLSLHNGPDVDVELESPIWQWHPTCMHVQRATDLLDLSCFRNLQTLDLWLTGAEYAGYTKYTPVVTPIDYAIREGRMSFLMRMIATLQSPHLDDEAAVDVYFTSTEEWEYVSQHGWEDICDALDTMRDKIASEKV